MLARADTTASSEQAPAVCTTEDEEEFEYDKWYSYDPKSTIADQPSLEEVQEIWPLWCEGVPTTFRRLVGSPSFHKGRVHHRYRTYYVSLELDWNPPYALSRLESNYRLLPSNYKSEWSGVYRIFSANAVIDRCCGNDLTGTLYIGQAGSRGRNWSILRTRLMSIAKREHHALNNWSRSKAVQTRFPW